MCCMECYEVGGSAPPCEPPFANGRLWRVPPSSTVSRACRLPTMNLPPWLPRLFPPRSRANEPFAIFVNFVLLPSMLRRKIKMLADPTELVRFPYQTTLHEHPTTYLAHQARHASSTGRRTEAGQDWIRFDRIQSDPID